MDLAEDDAEHSPAFEPELDTHDEELHDLNSNEQDSDEHISKPSSPGMALSESDAGDDTDSDEWSPGSDNGSSIHSDTSIEYRDTDNNDIEEELADLGDTDAETSIAAAEDVGSWQGDVGEEDVGMAGDDPLSETVSDREEEDKEDEVVQDATMEHSPSLEPILEDSQRSGGKPDSEASNSTTYSQAIIRATNERQRAEDTLLDLAHNVPGSVDEPEFPEWERKLENMNKLLIHWHRHDLPFNNERINVAIRTVRQHAAHLTRKRRDGGGAGNDREPKPAQEEESEDDDFKITNEFLSPAQRILLCKSAQELIDDLEQQPVIPTFGQDNLPDAIEAVQRRSQYLSAYFGLIKAGKALPWLQMRGPLAANLINIWTWHHEFGVEANLHHIQDVDLAFGQDWSLLGILRAVETSEVGSVDARHTIDLYSRTAVRAIINVSRPWPSFPNAPLIRVSAFMTLTNTHWRDTMNHRSLWQSPPTHFFATCLFELMRYTQKWHLTYDLESWPIPMMGFPVALLNQLVLELNNVAPPPKLFTDEDLANMEGGGRPVTADEVYEGIIRHTQHILKKHDRRIARVHAKYKRKSRRKAFGNILPDTLRAPSPLLEIEYIPPLRVALSIKDWDEKSLKPNIRTLQFTMDDVDRALADKWYEGNADNDTAPPEEWVEIDDSEWLDVGTIEHLEKLDRKGRQKAAPLA
ncbi:hypothetical protein CALCODRAFT_488688 [Calocera cornea HHB12733]|uniref:Uncharacterized protein n=1 Tax=Calocera cornea HHB12733 TaxID=1353952 RepID=A0A165C9V1_9BASI|nr:hypothetical protein CALCODRAFT_488688 [Calocera cornea HHB12733]